MHKISDTHRLYITMTILKETGDFSPFPPNKQL